MHGKSAGAAARCSKINDRQPQLIDEVTATGEVCTADSTYHSEVFSYQSGMLRARLQTKAPVEHGRIAKGGTLLRFFLPARIRSIAMPCITKDQAVPTQRWRSTRTPGRPSTDGV